MTAARRVGWEQSAQCRGADWNLFRPEQPRLAAAATIRRFCDSCPVTSDCMALADAHGDKGIWGGRYISGSPRRSRTANELDPTASGQQTDGAERWACPSCHLGVALRADRRLRQHRDLEGRSCPGGGELPIGAAS